MLYPVAAAREELVYKTGVTLHAAPVYLAHAPVIAQFDIDFGQVEHYAGLERMQPPDIAADVHAQSPPAPVLVAKVELYADARHKQNPV